MRKILTIFIYSFFLFACAPNEPLDHLCQINNKTKKSDTQSDVKEISRDINLFVVNHDLYLDYNFKKIYSKYKEMNSNYLKLKVIDHYLLLKVLIME